MTRTFAIAAILSLTAGAAGAQTLSDQVHAAAEKVCAARVEISRPVSFYGAMEKACVTQVSAYAMHKLAADAKARLMASTASNN